MAEAITVARPYAQAVFMFADAHHTLKDWSDMLALLAGISDDAAMRELIESPQLSAEQRADLFIKVGGEHLNEKCANFLHVLAGNGRLQLLPEIAALFEIQRRAAEGTIQAEMVTAFPATEVQQASVVASLRKRLDREVELSCSVDPGLLGGAIIRAGDLVIDGSVRGKLERLGNALTH
jgi:F-type H+-transporting ATPase subunit delta